MPIPYSTASAFSRAISGINTHMNYETYDNAGQVAAFVRTLGATSARDGLHFWPNNDAMNWLYSNLCGLGTDFDYVVDPSERLGTITQTMLNTYCWLSNRRVSYFEGPNEMDYRGLENWAAVTRAYQQKLAEAERPLAQGLVVPLIAPSLADYRNAYQLGDLTAYCDRGNLHAYPGGKEPEGVIEPMLTAIKSVSGNKPVIVTECGYSTAIGDAGSVSEIAQAKYTLRMMVCYFAAGIEQIYLYELLDQEPELINTDPQLHFGLVRYDRTQKPLYQALKNMLRIVGKSAGPITKLDYEYSGPLVASFLLQAGDQWVMFLWQALPVYQDGKDITNPDVNVVLTFPAQMPVAVYKPLVQENPIAVFNSKTIPLPVSDHPLVLRIG